MLSSTIMNGKLVVGGEKGGLRFWQVGVWDDNEETLVAHKGSSADVLTNVPEDVGNEQMLAVGMDDGKVRFVGMSGKRQKGLPLEVSHDDKEGVLALDFELRGRMCSGGGQVVKVWEESIANGQESDEVDEESPDEVIINGKRDHEHLNDSNDDKPDASEDDSSEEEQRKKRKKRKRSKGKGKGKHGQNGILGFRGMD